MSTDREKQAGANTAGQSELIKALGLPVPIYCPACGRTSVGNLDADYTIAPGFDVWTCPECDTMFAITTSYEEVQP